MSKKFQMFLALLLALSMVLGACGSPASVEPVAEVEATEAVMEEVVTEEPAVETGPDVLALFTDLAASSPADKGTAPSNLLR
ncbi:MAG: hypothetical protein IPG80_09425 [Anaerolineales bacterium]|uniref:hypothetical protein n=1 Tax=Candidatus Villigracilis vicinus TaxID=3140679 RepID=UPI0031352968|nr:hypothetical protein [Anaerolineales bacterium]